LYLTFGSIVSTPRVISALNKISSPVDVYLSK